MNEKLYSVPNVTITPYSKRNTCSCYTTCYAQKKKTNKLDFCMKNTNGTISAMWMEHGCIKTMTFMFYSKKEIINLLRNKYNLIVSKAQERRVYAL